MNTVKVSLGFIELALALKFLSKADLVSKTFFLKRELFIVLWILIALGLLLYLFGIIRFPHDDKKQKISAPRKAMGVLVLSFTWCRVFFLQRDRNCSYFQGFYLHLM